MNGTYPEIDRLKTLWLKHAVKTKTDRGQLLQGKSYYPKVQFTLGGQNFELFVDDEYDDLERNTPLLSFCLILRELEGYAYTPDYEVWCQERSLDPNAEDAYQAFKQLEKVYGKVKSILGKIDSQISDFDFELNAGAAQALRKIN